MINKNIPIAFWDNMLYQTVETLGNYLKEREYQKTEREKIRANFRLMSEQIQLYRDVFVSYISNTFEERKELYDLAREYLIYARESNDIECAREIFSFILAVYRTNPLEAINSKLKGDSVKFNSNIILGD